MTAPDDGGYPDLGHIDCWVFDLDNTLYPAACDLFSQVDRRMGSFIAEALSLPPDAARALQKHYFRTYGTTLRGLMDEHGVDPAAYLAYVHDIDLSGLAPSPRLDAVLRALPGRKVIYTNGSRAHAARVTARLGIAGRFEATVDIAAAGYDPKPSAAAFEVMLARLAIDPRRAVMVEDIARNLDPARAAGMVTVWLKGAANWAMPSAEDAVDHVAEDLTVWLEGVAARLSRAGAG